MLISRYAFAVYANRRLGRVYGKVCLMKNCTACTKGYLVIEVVFFFRNKDYFTLQGVKPCILPAPCTILKYDCCQGHCQFDRYLKKKKKYSSHFNIKIINLNLKKQCYLMTFKKSTFYFHNFDIIDGDLILP